MQSINTVDESGVIDHETFRYNRSTNEPLIKLSKKLSSFYNNNKVIITSSGMDAITTTILSIAIFRKWTNFNLIYSNELYCDTPRFISNFSETYSKITTWPIDVEDCSNIEYLFDNHITKQFNVLFVESCSNPNGKIIDWKIIDKLRLKSEKLIVIVDNTWLTHIVFNPFDYGADIVLFSMTKYYSGGTAISGAIVFNNNDLYDIAEKKKRFEGHHINPKVCDNISLMVDSMELRLENSYNLTIQIINCLSSDLIINYPRSELFKKFGPSIFTIDIKIRLKKVQKILKKFINDSTLPLITSFGSAHCKIDPWPTERCINNEYITTIRISVGYLDVSVNSVVSKINELLNMLK